MKRLLITGKGRRKTTSPLFFHGFSSSWVFLILSHGGFSDGHRVQVSWCVCGGEGGVHVYIHVCEYTCFSVYAYKHMCA